MKEKYIKFGLSFQVPSEVSKKAITLSKELGSKNKAKFILDGQNFYPHLTIYPPHYPAENLPKIINSVEGIIQDAGVIKMVFSEVGSKNGYVAIYFQLTPEIKALHKNLVEVLNPFREGYINPKYSEAAKMERFTSQEIVNIKDYGYPYVMDCYYHPHLSLIRLEDVEQAKAVINDVEWNIKEFKVDKLILHRIGDNGGAIEVIKEFNLN
ncbi:DUF1045 domain-containing protein [bacterium]|nr:DUF1045 domain-containing protein [bacterium]